MSEKPGTSLLGGLDRWFPEIKLAVLVSLTLSVAFPPFVNQGSEVVTFLGWRSVFTQEAGSVSPARLLCLWLLVLLVAFCCQRLGEYLLRGRPPTPLFFGSPLSAPRHGSAVALATLALPVWLFLCGTVVGRSKILALEDQVGYLGCTVLQLVVLSRLLLLLTCDRGNLQIGYGVLCVSSLAWDLRMAADPAGRVAGLAPLYILTGSLLYLYDLRFVEPSAPRPATNPDSLSVSTAEPPEAPVLSPPSEEEPNAILEAPASDPLAAPDAEPAIDPGVGESEPPAKALPSSSDPPETSAPADEEPSTPADPYQKYRPKP